MKTVLTFIVVVTLLASCAHLSTNDFVQGPIRITPPIQTTPTNASFIPLGEGGTEWGWFTDAKGRRFEYYVDYRIGTKTRGAIYLMAYPTDNEAEFKRKLNFPETLNRRFDY